MEVEVEAGGEEAGVEVEAKPSGGAEDAADGAGAQEKPATAGDAAAEEGGPVNEEPLPELEPELPPKADAAAGAELRRRPGAGAVPEQAPQGQAQSEEQGKGEAKGPKVPRQMLCFMCEGTRNDLRPDSDGCRACGTTGLVPREWIRCVKCHGSGNDPNALDIECVACGSLGHLKSDEDRRPCFRCGGSGNDEADVKLACKSCGSSG